MTKKQATNYGQLFEDSQARSVQIEWNGTPGVINAATPANYVLCVLFIGGMCGTSALRPAIDIGKWTLGIDNDKTSHYDGASSYAEKMKTMQQTVAAKSLVLDQLKNGVYKKPIDATYDASAEGEKWKNVMRDACTYINWESSCNGVGSRELATLGSYDLTVGATSIDEKNHTES